MRRSAPATTLAIAKWTVTLWLRETGRVFGVSARRVALSAVAVCLLAGGIGTGIALATGIQLDGAAPPEIVRLMLSTSNAGVVLTSAILCVTITAIIPRRSSLTSLIELLPVSRVRSYVGQALPVAGLTSLLSLVLSGTAFTVVLETSPGWAWSLRGVVAQGMLILWSIAIAFPMVTLFQSAARRWLRVPEQYSTTIAGFAVIGLFVAMTVRDLTALRPDAVGVGLSTWSPHILAVRVSTGSWEWTDGAALAGWLLMPPILVKLAARAASRLPDPLVLRFPQGTRPVSARPWTGLVWFETLVALRSPQTWIALLTIPALIGLVAWIDSFPPLGAISDALAGASFTLPFLLGAYAVGRTRRTHWVSHLATGSRFSWAFPKWSAYLVISTAIGVPTLAVLLLLDLVGPGQVADLCARALLIHCAALFGSSLAPHSDEQPVGIVATGFVVGVLYLSASQIISWVSESSTLPGAVVASALAALFVSGYVATARKSSADNVARV